MKPPVQSSTDVRVPITSHVRGTTYKQLANFAAENDVTVGQVLAELADRAVGIRRPDLKGKGNVRMTPERQEQLVRMRTAGHSLSAISRAIGVSLSSVHNHVKRLGL